MSFSVDDDEGITLNGGSKGVGVVGDLSVGTLSTSSQTVRGSINELFARLTDRTSANIVTDQYTSNVRTSIAKAEKIGNKLVHIMIQVLYSVNIPVSTTFAIIPSGYRPKANISVPAVIRLSSGGTYSYTVNIGSNGNITQGFSGSAVEFYIDTIYAIN